MVLAKKEVSCAAETRELKKRTKLNLSQVVMTTSANDVGRDLDTAAIPRWPLETVVICEYSMLRWMRGSIVIS